MNFNPIAMTNELNAILREFTSLQYKFHQFEAIVGTENQNVELLNNSAPGFFHMVHNVLWADLLMHLTRLTGPATTTIKNKKVQNLSIRRLRIGETENSNIDLMKAIKDAIDACRFAIDARNKILAHTDLETALSPNAGGVTLGSREMLSNAIDAIRLVIASVFPIPIMRNYSSRKGGAEDLLACLILAEKSRSISTE